MSLEKFFIGALVVFLLGIGILYSGVNRAPFREHSPGSHHPHTHSTLPVAAGDSYRV